ncbi:MAG: hypothetical protein WCE75_16965 [Terracidiphilus sp.]
MVELNRSQAPSLNFPTTTNVGSTDTTDGTQTVQVANIGNLPLVFTGLGYPADFSEAVGDPSACTSSSSLSAGQQCDLPVSFMPTAAGSLSESVTLTDNALNGSPATQSITVTGTATQVTPIITWSPPASITYGTALSGTQLDASSTVAGNFVYSPTSGTVLSAGPHTLSVTFTPTKTAEYATVQTTVTLTVLPTPDVLTSPTPGDTLTGSSATFN